MEVVLDPANRVAYVRTSRHPALPYLHNRMGAVFFPTDQAGANLIAHVMPKSPAELAGIRDGDVLLKVDQQPAGAWRTDAALLKRMGGRVPSGTKVVYTVQRGSETLDFAVTARDIL
jgi:S1-C subfamily serine protease